MKQEIEAKFINISKDDIRNRLRDLDGILVQEDVLMRRAVFDKRLNPNILCTYARVRDEGTRVTMSLKVNAQKGEGIEAQKELEMNINSFEDGRNFIKGLGLKETGYQENKRETWQFMNTEVVIDTWPNLDPYVEIEGSSEDSVKSAAEELGLDWESRIFVSTDELYAERYGLTKEEALEAMSVITFDEVSDKFEA